MKVAVLMGGISKEREVSLRSGTAVSSALKRKGYVVAEIDATRETLIAELQQSNPDVVFIALHGSYGEDGPVQGILEWLLLPYTGSSVFVSALCFDKVATKDFLIPRGVNTPDYVLYDRSQDLDTWIKNYTLGYPSIVKPNKEGSTIGMSRVWKASELKPAIKTGLQFDDKILIEKYITGREVTVGLCEGQVFPVVEVVPESGFYDYEAKYTKGKTNYIVPATLSKDQTASIQKLSQKIYDWLGCEGGVRVDYMISEQGVPFFLEVNTIPGMTETSLLPKAAQAYGLSFDDLCEQILKSARLKCRRTL